MSNYLPAEKPTFYFIGVSTGKSSIMRVFPAWAKFLGLGEVAIKGIDLKLHDSAENYREAVRFIKADPLSVGALVTSHKIDVLQTCRDLFDELDFYAQATGEISCIAKRDGCLRGCAKDPISSGLTLEAFLPADHWKTTGAEVLVLGAGGSGVAVVAYLLDAKHGDNRPACIRVADRNPGRLQEVAAIHQRFASPVPVECRQVASADDNDRLVDALPPRSLVINATGLGKDAPGSPLTNTVRFPEGSYVWEFNYRGDLLFLAGAKAQAKSRGLHVEDGWLYFVHGWTQVIAEVFSVAIPTAGPVFDQVSRIALDAR